MAWKPSALRMPLGAGLLLLGAMISVGCSTTETTTTTTRTYSEADYQKEKQEVARLSGENRSLRDRNAALTSELSLAKDTADQSALRNAQLQAELNESKGELQKTRLQLADALDRPAPKETVVVKTGFDNIPGATVDTSSGDIAVSVSSDVLFAPGKAILRSNARKTLDQIAKVLNENYGKHEVKIEGYTDSTPIKRSSWKDNLELSAARAMSVQRYLISKGVKSKMFSAAYGPQDPVADNDSPAGRAKNRRVEIVVIR